MDEYLSLLTACILPIQLNWSTLAFIKQDLTSLEFYTKNASGDLKFKNLSP
jgi:hypothetical protein